MKKMFLILLLAVSGSFAASDTDMILHEIKTLREDMNKRFEQVDKRFEQVDKRFEQIDKRVEQVDKRLDLLQSIVYLLLGISIASPFVLEYMRNRRESEERKTLDSVKSMLFVLREMAQEDEKLAKKLKAAGLV